MIEKWIVWLSTMSVVLIVWFFTATTHDSYRGYLAMQDFKRIAGADIIDSDSPLDGQYQMTDWIEQKYCPNIKAVVSDHEPKDLNTDYLTVQISKDGTFCYVDIKVRGAWMDILGTDLRLLWFPFWILVVSGTVIALLFVILAKLSKPKT
jgi:hypothetical protein